MQRIVRPFCAACERVARTHNAKSPVHHDGCTGLGKAQRKKAAALLQAAAYVAEYAS